MPNRGVLPATSKERGSTSALRWTWHNRKRASGMDGRGLVRQNGDFVSGDPQSEPDTQESPPEPSYGGPDRRPRQRAHHAVTAEPGGSESRQGVT